MFVGTAGENHSLCCTVVLGLYNAVVPGVSTIISTNKDRISSSDEEGNTSDEGSIEEEENSSYDGINGYDEEDRKPKAKRYKKKNGRLL
jgi:hypothetical protein